jgi:hypothetical protein
MPNPRLLTPAEAAKRRDNHKFLAGDTETRGLGGDFIEGAIYDGAEAQFYRDPETMLAAFIVHKYRGYTLGFHNLEYDLRYFLPILRSVYLPKGYAVSVTCRKDDTIIAVKVTKDKASWVIADTYALMPVALAALAPLAGIKKANIGLADGVEYDPLIPEHREYLRGDVQMLWLAYTRLCDILYDTYQIYPGLTAGSTAVKAIRRTLKRVYWRQSPKVEAFCREAYFGGIAFLKTVKEQTDAVQVDANGMYAWGMEQGVPVGAAAYTRKEMPDVPGIYRCQITAPETIGFTFVPKRTADGVLWPHGKWEEVLCSNTIHAARQRGYTIEVIEGYAFQAIDFPFSEFTARCWELEQSDKGGPLGLTMKILRNSGYGKFGQGVAAKEYLFTEEPDWQNYTPVVDEKTGEDVPGLVYRDVVSERPYMMVHWAAFITASARNNLADAAYTVGPEHVYNGDTDSLFADRAAVEASGLSLGKRYGQYKVEAYFDTVQPQAPKCYVGVTREGKQVNKAKGLGRNISYDDQRGPNPEATMTTVRKNLMMAKTGKPSVSVMRRKLTNIENSHGWKVTAAKTVVPVRIDEECGNVYTIPVDDGIDERGMAAD